MRATATMAVALLLLLSGCAIPVEGEVNGNHRVTVGFAWPNQLPRWIRVIICSGDKNSATRACEKSEGFGLFDSSQCPDIVAELRESECDEFKCDSPGKYEKCLCPEDPDPEEGSGWQHCDIEGFWGKCERCPEPQDNTDQIENETKGETP